MATTYLTRTPSSAGNRKKFTISMWVKRVKLGVDQWLVQAGASGSEFDIRFTTSDQIRFTTWDGSNGYGMITTRVFRDVSAWYHLVFQYDTAQATDTNRNKIYVNGEQISPSDTSAYNAGKHPPQNYDNPSWNNTTAFRINDVTWTSSSPKDAVYSHIHHTDGYAYDASTFGSTDATSGIWKINTSPSVTYGTNGFFILKDGNTITDSSPNSNNFSLGGGTLTKTEDCPSNVFATLNSLATSSYGTLIQGNNTVKGNTSTNSAETFSTLSTNNDGKYYYEIKCTVVNGVDNPNFGFIQTARGFRLQNGEPGLGGATNGSLDIRVQPNGKTFDNGAASGSAVISTYTAGDILGFAIDSDNGAFYVSKNGVWQTSGNPESGASRTGAIKTWSPTDSKVTEGQSVCIGVYNTSIADANFGNGYFGTTAVTSAGTNASSNGIFEYDVPTGYTALSTKGLNL